MYKKLTIILSFILFILIGFYVFKFIIVSKENKQNIKIIERKTITEEPKIELSSEEIIKNLNDSIYLIRRKFFDSITEIEISKDSISIKNKKAAKDKKIIELLQKKLKNEKELTIKEHKEKLLSSWERSWNTIRRETLRELRIENDLGRLYNYTEREIRQRAKRMINNLGISGNSEKYALQYRMTKSEYETLRSIHYNKFLKSLQYSNGKIIWPHFKLLKENNIKINKEFLFNACLEGFVKNQKMNHFKDSNANDFCNCFAKKVDEEFSKKELSDLEKSVNNSSEKFIEKAYFLFKNQKIKSLVEKCFGDVKFNNDSYIELNEVKKQAFINNCKDNFLNGMSQIEINDLNKVFKLEKYCECLTIKMISEFTVPELADFNSNIPNRNINNQNLKKLNKMAENCAAKNYY
tara:strand:- start:155 stop:1378 length:1224 start_codon:yes stop_codon:yes gene_type:complete